MLGAYLFRVKEKTQEKTRGKPGAGWGHKPGDGCRGEKGPQRCWLAVAWADASPARKGHSSGADQRGSSIRSSRSPATSLRTCTAPLGHRISIAVARVSGPSPKCNRRSLVDMKPTEPVTWL